MMIPSQITSAARRRWPSVCCRSNRRNSTTMAFRKHNSNVLSPIFSEDSTWSLVASVNTKKTNKARPEPSKENYYVVPPKDLGSFLHDCDPFNAVPPPQYGSLQKHSSSSSSSNHEAIPATSTWGHSDNIVPRRGAFNEVRRSDEDRPSFSLQQQQNVLPFDMEHVGSVFQGKAHGHWDEAPIGNDISAKSQVYDASKAMQRPSDKRTVLQPHKQGENQQSLKKAASAVPQVMIRFIPRPNDGFNMETLKPAPADAAPIPSTRGYSVPPGFTSYSAATRSYFPDPPKTKKTIPSFEIYAEHRSEEQEQRPSSPIPFTLEKYGRQLHSLSESCDRGSAQKAESILRTIILKYKNGMHDIQPDGACYNSVIHAYAKAGMPHQAENAMRLMFTDYQNGNATAEPNVRCFTNVLHAWRKSQDPEAPERCEGLIAQMREISSSASANTFGTTLPNCKPDTFAITVLLHCWVESNREDAADRAEVHFRQMKAQFLEGDEAMRPDCISYSILLNTFAQKMQIEAAEDMLWEMVEDYLDGNKAAEPRTRNFNTIMAMHSRSSKTDAPDRAEAVMKRFRELSNQRAVRIKPDEYTYSLLLKTWITSARPDGIEQAVSRLEWMRTLSDAGDEAALPDIVKYTTIVSAYARNGDVGNSVKFLNIMIGDYLNGKNGRVKPDVGLFDLVIKGCTAGDSVTASNAISADSILRRMWHLHESGLVGVRPQVATTYKYVIVGFKKADMPQQAEELLWEMERKCVGKPPKTLYQTVLNAWHDSRHPDKQQRINSLRLAMNDRFDRKTNSEIDSNGGSKRYYRKK